VTSGNVFFAITYAIPAFAGGDRPSPPYPPVGNLTNTVSRDIDNQTRTNTSPPGPMPSTAAALPTPPRTSGFWITTAMAFPN